MKKIRAAAFAMAAMSALTMMSTAVCADEVTETASVNTEQAQFLIVEDGLRYKLCEDGTMKLYSGTAIHYPTLRRNLFNEGKRCVGWRTFKGQQFYFDYEGGALVGEHSIEDGIYTFDENGVLQAENGIPRVYAYNFDEPFSASDLPEYIDINYYYDASVGEYFEIKDEWNGPVVEKLIDNKWTKIGMDYKYMRENDIVPSKPRPKPVKQEEKVHTGEDTISIMTARYNDRLTPGHYSAVIKIEPTRKGVIAGFSEREIRVIFRIDE